MQMMWFRNDLRAVDNQALQACMQQSQSICAIYIHCSGQMIKHNVGLARQLFHLRHVSLLFKMLKTVGVPCLYYETDDFFSVPSLLQQCVDTMSIHGIWFNAEYGAWELERDECVRIAMAERGIGVHTFNDGLILPPYAVTQKSGQPYKVFTPFKNRWLSIVEETHIPSYHMLPQVSVPQVSVLQQFEESGFSLLYARIEQLTPLVPISVIEAWPVGLEVAQQRLALFIDNVLNKYETQRDFPDLQGTSQLSPYLSSGVISARYLYQIAKSTVYSEGQQVWISELVWRDFYRHVMVCFPQVSQGKPFNENYIGLQWLENKEHLQAWQSGCTGVPLVDAGMRQLLKMGWMHNRVRMVVAMYLSKNLFLDWRLGEQHFMQNLIDGDFASNNGGWQWSASVGTDAAPYFRIFNPLTQAVRFDPQGDYIRRYVPELSSVPLRWILKADRYQKELIDAGYYPLLVDLKDSRQSAIEAFKRFKA